jgi:hypothetical protein
MTTSERNSLIRENPCLSVAYVFFAAARERSIRLFIHRFIVFAILSMETYDCVASQVACQSYLPTRNADFDAKRTISHHFVSPLKSLMVNFADAGTTHKLSTSARSKQLCSTPSSS